MRTGEKTDTRGEHTSHSREASLRQRGGRKSGHLHNRRASLGGYGVGTGARMIWGWVRFALGVVAPWSSREFQPELAM
jgi:hypothetical protein